MIPFATPECQQCAACCFSELTRYVQVTGNDYARLGEAAESYVQFIENRAYMRPVDGHCAALKFDMQWGQFICQEYENRPEVCRGLQRNSAACRAEREVKGERSLVFLRRKDPHC